MKCPRNDCRAEAPPGSSYCDSCGTRLTEIITERQSGQGDFASAAPTSGSEQLMLLRRHQALASPGPHSPRARVARAPAVRREPALLRGHVQNLLWQNEAAIHMNVCRFQIARQNAQGKTLPMIPVEMRSMSFHGTLNNRDRVELRRAVPIGQLETPKRIENITTGVPFMSTIGFVNRYRALPTWWVGLTAAFVIAWLVLVAWFISQIVTQQ